MTDSAEIQRELGALGEAQRQTEKKVDQTANKVDKLVEAVHELTQATATVVNNQNKYILQAEKHQANSEAIEHILNRQEHHEEEIETLGKQVEKNTAFREMSQNVYIWIARPVVAAIALAGLGLIAAAIVG